MKAIGDKFKGSVAEANVLAAEKAHEYVERERRRSWSPMRRQEEGSRAVAKRPPSAARR